MRCRLQLNLVSLVLFMELSMRIARIFPQAFNGGIDTTSQYSRYVSKKILMRNDGLPCFK